MKNLFIFVALLTLLPEFLSQTNPTPQSNSLVLTHVTLIDMTGAPPRPDMTIVISGERITALGPSSVTQVPKGARVVDGKSKFLIPGLWDMHVHLTDAKASALPALVANGVTGVRDMGSLLPQLDNWRCRIENQLLVGPRIIRAGPVLNGKAFGPNHLEVGDAAEARSAVRTLNKIGVDFIKIHATLTREEFFAIADEAKRLGMSFCGHLPIGVTPAEASDAGQASIEHTETLFVGTPYLQMQREDLLKEMTSLFQRFAKNGTAYTPTLIMYKSSADWRDFISHPEDKYVARSAYEAMQQSALQYKKAPELVAGRKRVLETLIMLVGMMRQNGVKVMVGTDLADGRIFPGFSVHEELALLVDAGFTPYEALQSATRVPAAFLNLADTGTIEQGKRADLVLLNRNPLQDIHNSTSIESVLLRGRLFDRQALGKLLAEAEHLASMN